MIRRCAFCNKRLSIYNDSDFCFCHQTQEGRNFAIKLYDVKREPKKNPFIFSIVDRYFLQIISQEYGWGGK